MAEVIEEMGIQEDVIGVAPVGCAVFIYKFLDIDFQQAAHGRAPAVATAIKRLMPNKYVFTYQGDGDLAAIGTAETIHACNRGENKLIIYINNGIYGMNRRSNGSYYYYGMKTATCPYGRNNEVNGYPLNITNLLAILDGTCYVTVKVCTMQDRYVKQNKLI
jgi:2-oxoglutarate ferredoxin oxidoreductase subunit beta